MAAASEELAVREQIRNRCSQPWTLMEVCGGQTHALLRHGIDQLLPETITLIHGPGCPVCVTALERIDQALAAAEQQEVILCSYGDMLRVPGSNGRDLLSIRAQGGDVRVVYSPLDVLEIAQKEPQRQVVFFAVGFETTAPATALLAQKAITAGVNNLQLLVAHVRVAPVLDQLLADPACQVQGVLAAGHVCTVMGEAEHRQLVARHRVPIVVTGFSAKALLQGIDCCITQLEAGEHRLENAYTQAVAPEGNGHARQRIEAVFENCDTTWRGLGVVTGGGMRLRAPYNQLAYAGGSTAASRSAPLEVSADPCPSALVLQGLLKPSDCPSFAGRCTPEQPLGAPMVSSEGACAAYYRYSRRRV